MQIRIAEQSDYDEVIRVFLKAHDFMQKNGNFKQWNDIERQKKAYRNDILLHQLFVMEENDEIHAVFALIIGEDPTYQGIEKGEWMDSSMYGTIHRIASDGEKHGIFHEAVSFAWKKIPHLRIDTHQVNRIMQECILKEGFQYCGIIHIADGTERLAFEKIKTVDESEKCYYHI